MSHSSVDVMFPAKQNMTQWIARYEKGEVPGRWPYGLQEVSKHAEMCRWFELNEPSLPMKVGVRLGLAVVRRARSRPGSIGLTWDENTARLMRSTQPRDKMYTGVIWLTDALPTLTAEQLVRARTLLRQMDGLWVLSQAQIDPLREFLGATGPAVHKVRFGVDEGFYQAHPYPAGSMVVSIGGDRHRDTVTLFDALDEVRRASPGTRIVVQTSSDLPAPNGIEKHAYFTQRQLKDIYRQASVVAIATHWNLHVSGMTVSLEAMSTGRPVVITETPAMDDYIRNGETGLLTPVGDPIALADGVLKLLNDRALARTMGRAGRAFVEQSGSTTHLVEDLATIFA